MLREHVLGFDERVQFYTANKRMDSGCQKEQKLLFFRTEGQYGVHLGERGTAFIGVVSVFCLSRS